MIYIKKGKEPEEFKKWKEENEGANYHQGLTKEAITALRNALLQEQGYVCCFCGCAIGPYDFSAKLICQKSLKQKDSHNISNAHIIPQSKDLSMTLEYNNICASCDTRKHFWNTTGERHCDDKQGKNDLPITPLQEDCISFFSFKSDGSIDVNEEKSEEDRKKAKETIDILGLDVESLKVDRANCIKELQKLPFDKIEQALIRLTKRDKNNAFTPYYFVPLRYFKRI